MRKSGEVVVRMSCRYGQWITCQLLPGTLHLRDLRLGDISFFTFLGSMKPTANAQSIHLSVYHNLFDGVKAMSGLHLEEHKLVPNRRNAFFWDGLGLPFTIDLFDGIQLE